MLQCTNLTKCYKKKTVVDNLSFQVRSGEVFALLGSNGAGKTTTIKMILGLVKADKGSVTMQEHIRIGYSPDTPYFPHFLTGRETLEYYAAIGNAEKSKRDDEIKALLKLVGLQDDKTKVRSYSKGMLQRLSVAQALLDNPDLLFLDEPTAGLDALGRIEIIRLIGKLQESGKTIILNSHILSDIEQVCSRGLIMDKGRLLGTWEKHADNHGKSLQDIFLELVGGVEE